MECPDCSSSISTEAYVCPKCGRPTGKRPTLKAKKLLILCAALVIAFFVTWQFPNNGDRAG
jgi:DNA-directed RNA polymerase subunit RPC12/RpoP